MKKSSKGKPVGAKSIVSSQLSQPYAAQESKNAMQMDYNASCGLKQARPKDISFSGKSMPGSGYGK